MANFTGSVAVSIQGELTSTQSIGQASYPISYINQSVLTSGTGSYQANQGITATRTLTASASENLDLSGSMGNAFNTTTAFTKVKVLMVSAAASNTNDVLVGGAASAQAGSFFGDVSDVLRVKPGGSITLTAPDAGYAITATTADLLKVANSGAGTAVTYTIVVIGVE